METINLNPQDVRVGTKNADGSVKAWPVVDIRGKGYERVNATIWSLEEPYFVVLSIGQGHPELEVHVVTPAQPVRPVRDESK